MLVFEAVGRLNIESVGGVCAQQIWLLYSEKSVFVHNKSGCYMQKRRVAPAAKCILGTETCVEITSCKDEWGGDWVKKAPLL